MRVYYDRDADLNLIKSKKVVIVGYGSQGRAHALNLKDSGAKELRVALKPGSATATKVEADGLQVMSVADAAKWGDLLMMATPDELQADIWKNDIAANIRPGAAIAFAHGLNIHFGLIEAPKTIDVVMIAPKGPGHTVRGEYQKGGGVPCLIAINQDASGDVDADGIAPADGAVTARAGVVCAVLTADCLPVLLTDVTGRRVGVAHAGWRGLLHGVLTAAVRALRVPGDKLLAWLGPAIGQAAYEVGADVRDAFLADNPGAAARFMENPRGRWQADLYGLARDSLSAAGVTAVYGGGFCTFRESTRFYSHRREAPCGRMATLIWREPRP